MHEQHFQQLIADNEPLPCQDAPELFFSRDKTRDGHEDEESAVATEARYRMAKKMCGKCPIRQQCLSYAMVNDIQHGVWGQTLPHERRRIRNM